MQSANEMPRYPLFINGEYCEPASGEYTQVINPATGDVVGEVAMGNEADVDKAVAAARNAFDNNSDWRRMSPEKRGKVLKQCAQIVLANAQELALLEVSCSGGTLNRVAGMDIMAVADLFGSLGDEVTQFPFVEALPTRPLPELVNTQVWREPIGVCSLITAWNFPLLLFAMKVAPALAAGNTMIVKPAEITPTSTVRLVELLNTVLPKGVLNVVVGAGSVVGEALTLHKDVDKVSFTGSTSIGRHVQQNAALTMKRVTLELGGKGPGIVMPDADIERVAYGALWGVYMNAGQACESGTRLLVHEDIYDEMIQRLKEVSEEVVVGNPMDPATGMGPMSTETHYNKVMQYIESAVADGAEIVTGGKRADVAGCEGGFFVEPTVIVGVKNDMKVACEEIFGPVLSVIKYSSLDEAIAIANDSDYGLSAGVWTENVVQAQQIARDLRAGSVWINDWHMMRTDAPFGGYKQSGYGREFGKYSISSYVETKSVSTSFERNPAAKKMHKIVHTKLA
ncbi:MAG: aldehyde dehydrogenase [Cellvibrionaceae bacterium]|mgnify:CR=1 FL=1|nr:aldehyde dehydrogenase [Cellvibrionaceae bacterium]|tara:strand:+ start:10314 stop:11843 length:1530 start_codon:yes stop_codon:yes gene_type:complete